MRWCPVWRLLARIIAEYEEKVGPITAPGFEDFGKG